MKLLKTGDKCPCCGQPIVTEDERLLLILSAMADMMEDDNATHDTI